MKVSIPYFLWLRLLKGLRNRSKGIRESGAFLLRDNGSNKICKVVYYNQFDESVSDSGIIQFKGGQKLYVYLAENNLEVFADIHTHPTIDTEQSISDREHPMIRIKGHIAIIAPSFANSLFLMPEDCSFYEYKGSFCWRRIPPSAIPIKIKFL
ncbi:MAG TPA: hypothetical protein VK213_06520 [Bacteroidales bacterium]|jgi:proteasome lid subunit RPN8/RPN11|nr:hypothetical protein [Bacteroidales bacterium]